MIIHRQKPLEFNSPAEVIFPREDLKLAILWYSKKPVARLKHVFLYGRYYAVSIYDQKIHIHRLLMMFWLKRDLEPGEYVHHKDGNRFNNLRDNLEAMSAALHQSMTNKGRKFSELHRKRIGDGNRRRAKRIHENPALVESGEESRK